MCLAPPTGTTNWQFEISGFKSDFGDSAAGIDNDNAVEKNCGSLIKALK